jgi:16S rRNA (adenine1518-N6/adenine1519-N6)-dimethyltransferase
LSFVTPKVLLQRLGLRPNKALSQNFLLYPHQAQRIVAALALTGGETVVEIGAGLGALTVFLAPAAAQVVALERDPALCRFLEEELLAHLPQVQILCQDALKFDFLRLSREQGPLTVVGNLPYQITSPLLFKLVEEKAALKQAVLMMQQEVGDRLLAAPGTKEYGVLSVLLRYHFALERLFSLSRANFYPSPQVASVVLGLRPAPPVLAARDEALLRRVVKAAFATRRKTLTNTLAAQAAAFGLTREAMLTALRDVGIDPGRRGETLSVAEFVALSNEMVGAGPGIFS